MELLGADYCEHEVFHPGVGVTRAVSVLQHVPKFTSKVLSQRKTITRNSIYFEIPSTPLGNYSTL